MRGVDGMVKRELEEQMYRDTITQRDNIIAIQQYIEIPIKKVSL